MTIRHRLALIGAALAIALLGVGSTAGASWAGESGDQPHYLVAVWTMQSYPYNPQQTQALDWYDVKDTASAALAAGKATAEGFGSERCGFYQVDVYRYTTHADRTKVDALIDGGLLNNGTTASGGLPDGALLVSGGLGHAWAFVAIACVPPPEPTPTPTPTPTISVTPTPTPTPTEGCQVDCESPSPTPTPSEPTTSPTPTPSPSESTATPTPSPTTSTTPPVVPSTPPPSHPHVLAHTGGGPVGPVLAIGLALLALGTILALATRQRGRHI